MKKVKIITGSDTGNTEYVAKDIQKLLEPMEVEIQKVHNIRPNDWDADFYILGAPTWFDGECSQDWNWYIKSGKFGEVDFTDKVVAIYGLGDQVGYPDYYCDAIGILGNIVLHNGGELVGFTNPTGHVFDHSKGFNDDIKKFMGLALDEDNQPDLTHERLDNWVKELQIYLK